MNNRELDIWNVIQIELENEDLDEETKKTIIENIMKLKSQKINLLITGATGCGKSSTINALFNLEIAKVGYGVDPETMRIAKYELNNLVLWDSPGLGDSPEADLHHSKNIIDKLHEKDAAGNALIDLVLVIIDGSSRDMGTSYELINHVIIPALDNKDRILIAINQCDIAMKGKGWSHDINKPNKELEIFLSEKVQSVQRRVMESTGVQVTPIYYSALYKYNISKLLSFIIKYTPTKKRSVYINNLNNDPDVWKSNDNLSDYNTEIKKELKISIVGGLTGAAAGATAGATVGSLIPVVGTVVGAAVGAFVGFLGGFFRK